MSKYYKPIQLGYKHKNLNWINTEVAVHDLHCQCDDPLKHIIIGIIQQEPSLKFDKEESKLIQQCLTTSEDTGDAVDTLGEGDLDALFAQDVFGEKDTG